METITRIDRKELRNNLELYMELLSEVTDRLVKESTYEMRDKITPNLISGHVNRIWETSRVDAYAAKD